MRGNLGTNISVSAREAIFTTGATFQKNNVKFYFPIVTMSMNNNIRFLEHVKQ